MSSVYHSLLPALARFEDEANRRLAEAGRKYRVCMHVDRTVWNLDGRTIVECDYCEARVERDPARVNPPDLLPCIYEGWGRVPVQQR